MIAVARLELLREGVDVVVFSASSRACMGFILLFLSRDPEWAFLGDLRVARRDGTCLSRSSNEIGSVSAAAPSSNLVLRLVLEIAGDFCGG